MTRLIWRAVGESVYETGVDRGVLYVVGMSGVPWNGLTSVSENPSGGSSDAYYIDGVKYQNVPSSEEFEGVIEAFTYPNEFAQCEGTASPFNGLFVTAQPRKPFGLSYRTKVGNDIDGPEHGYKLHLVYNALAEPTNRVNKTVADATDPSSFSWKITTTPPPISGYKRTAHFVIDSRFASPTALFIIEDILYGNSSNDPRLPLPAEIFSIFTTNSSFVVVDNGDGTFTASGTDFEVHLTDPTDFQISTPDAVFIDGDSYTLSSP